MPRQNISSYIQYIINICIVLWCSCLLIKACLLLLHVIKLGGSSFQKYKILLSSMPYKIKNQMSFHVKKIFGPKCMGMPHTCSMLFMERFFLLLKQRKQKVAII